MNTLHMAVALAILVRLTGVFVVVVVWVLVVGVVC
jgi:hypothetical protein